MVEPPDDSDRTPALLAPNAAARLVSVVPCLDDAQILEFVSGQLDGGQLDAADAHLDTCTECRAVVSGLACSRGTTVSAVAPLGGRLARGAQLGRFVVLDLLGGGSMGLVYAAYDSKLDRRIALKLLRHDNSDQVPSGDEQLLAEARSMARLNHANVVQIHDVGRVGDTVYLAMALVDGVTLTAWLSARPRSWREVRSVFVQAGRGLAAAHAAGLVHRDFKPDNVIVGHDGQVRVTDFGLARGALGKDTAAPRCEPDHEDVLALSHTQTTTGALVGTPAYMAPEQLRGRGADARSDQYSFSVSLYEALYGTRPFHAESLADLIEQSSTDEPLQRPMSDVPRWLHGAVERGLCRRSEGRFPSMEHLLQAVDRSPSGRRRIGIASLVALASLAVAAIVLARSPQAAAPCTGSQDQLAQVWNESRRADVHAGIRATKASFAPALLTRLDGAIAEWTRDWTKTHTSTCRATQVSRQQSPRALDARMSCLARRLGELDAVLNALSAADTQTASRALDAVADLPALDTCADLTSLLSLPAPPRTHEKAIELSRLRTRIANVRADISLGSYRRATAAAKTLEEDAKTFGYAPTSAQASLLRADALRRSGKLRAARPIAFAALFTAQAARDDRNVAHAWLLLVAIAGERGAYTEAQQLVRHARAAVARLQPTPRLQAALASASGLIAYNLEQYEASTRALTNALHIRTRTFGDSHIAIARTYTSLGNLARARGKLDQAVSHHRRAQAIDHAIRGPGHPSAGRHLHNIAGVLRRQKRLTEALATYTKALAIKRQRLGKLHPAVALTHNSIGLVHYERTELGMARKSYLSALAIYDGSDTIGRARALHNLALVAAAQARHTEAITHLAAALRIYESSYGSSHAVVARLRDLRTKWRRPKRQPSAQPKRQPTAQPKRQPSAARYGAGQAWDAP